MERRKRNRRRVLAARFGAMTAAAIGLPNLTATFAGAYRSGVACAHRWLRKDDPDLRRELRRPVEF